ncbi:MAG: hypothetical protein PHH71_01965 [Clostridia bacterium]|nr:hypothetical protein [Clostridia bacterium]
MSIKSEKLYNITKIIIIIFLFPSIIAGLFNSFVLISTKANGGVPSFFNLRVVKIPNNNFYDVNSGKFMAGEHCPFSNVSQYDYSPGDIIAYYKYSEQNGNTIIIRDWNFEGNENSSEVLSGSQTSSAFYPISNTLNAENSQSVTEENTITLSFAEQTSDITPDVLLGKIAKVGIAFDERNVGYVCFSLYSDSTDTVDENLILAMDVVGKSTELSNFFINVMVFCSTTFSLLILLIPCVLLIILNIINITAKKITEKEEHQETKRMLIKQSKQLEGNPVNQQQGAVKRENAKDTSGLEKTLEQESRQDILKIVRENEIRNKELEKLKNEKDFDDD